MLSDVIHWLVPCFMFGELAESNLSLEASWVSVVFFCLLKQMIGYCHETRRRIHTLCDHDVIVWHCIKMCLNFHIFRRSDSVTDQSTNSMEQSVLKLIVAQLVLHLWNLTVHYHVKKCITELHHEWLNAVHTLIQGSASL